MVRRRAFCLSPPPNTTRVDGAPGRIKQRSHLECKTFRFRSAIRGRRCREQLRRIDCQRQRKVLVRPAKEAILKRWHFKARSGVGALTRRSRISKALRGKAEIISPR